MKYEDCIAYEIARCWWIKHITFSVRLQKKAANMMVRRAARNYIKYIHLQQYSHRKNSVA